MENVIICNIKKNIEIQVFLQLQDKIHKAIAIFANSLWQNYVVELPLPFAPVCKNILYMPLSTTHVPEPDRKVRKQKHDFC